MNSHNNFTFDGSTTQLEKLCIEIVDCHHSTPNWTESGKLVVRNFNIRNGRLHLNDTSFTDDETYNERIRRSKPEPGDLIITREAPMGEVCIIPEGVECCLGQRMVLIKPDLNKVSAKYLLYALQSEFVQKQIQKSDKTGSIVSNLRIPVLKELQIPSFDLAIEQKIGEILDAIVSKIEINNRVNAELEAMAKTVYDYWFVQFDFPNQNGKPYKASGGKMVWSEELKREIPEGWAGGKFKDVLETIESGDRPKGGIKRIAEGIPSIGAENILSIGRYDYGQEKLIPKEYFCRMKTGVVKSGDVLMYKDGASLGRVSMFKNGFPYEQCSINSHAFIVRSNQKISQNFLYFWLDQKHIKEIIVRLGMRAAQPGINQVNVNDLPILIPEPRLIAEFEFLIGASVDLIFENAKQNKRLSELRDWLLPMLMNGQIKIKDAEREMAMAAEAEVTYGKRKEK